MKVVLFARFTKPDAPRKHWASAVALPKIAITQAMAAFLVLSIAALPVGAEQRWWQGVVETTTTVGDTSSLAEARLVAIRHLQWQAAAAAGAQLTTTERLDDDRYSSVIELVSAAEVQLDDIKQSVTSRNDVVYLTLKAKAKTDLDVISRRMALVRENRDLAAALSALTTKYATLSTSRDRLAVLESPLINSYESEARRLLLPEESAALAHLSAQTKEALSRELVDAIEDELLHHTQVRSAIESVSAVSERGTYRVAVRVKATMPLNAIEARAGTYWKTTRVSDEYLGGEGLVIALDHRVNKNSPYDVLQQVARGLEVKQFVIEVQIGNQVKATPIAGVQGPWCIMCFRGVYGPADSDKNYTIRSINVDADPSNPLSNLLVIEVPRREFEGKNLEVSARVVRFYPSDRNWQQQYTRNEL